VNSHGGARRPRLGAGEESKWGSKGVRGAAQVAEVSSVAAATSSARKPALELGTAMAGGAQARSKAGRRDGKQKAMENRHWSSGRPWRAASLDYPQWVL
jgi:hypothetical protein